MQEITVWELLRDRFGQDPGKALEDLLCLCPAVVRKAAGAAADEELRLVKARVLRLESFFSSPPPWFPVDVLVQGTFSGSRRRKAVFRLRYDLELYPGSCRLYGPVVMAEDSVPEELLPPMQNVPADSCLLPVLSAQDYPALAHDLLQCFYPEALRRPTAVDGVLLAKRMGLSVQDVRFSAESGTLGMVTFGDVELVLLREDGTPYAGRIPAGTILINTDLCRRETLQNSTLVHECVHACLNRMFFLLQSQREGCLPCASRRQQPAYRAPARTPTDWMELQAEKLPAFLLMEEEQTRREAARRLQAMGGERSPANMRRLVLQLAAVFRVSAAMARCRLTQLGYPEAAGVLGWLDGRRIPDYGCASTWEAGRSYAISLRDAALLLGRSASFRRELESGDYVYLEGHFCLNHPRYVTYSEGKPAALTPYARRHMEECCLAFTPFGRWGREAMAGSFAERKSPVTNRYLPLHTFAAAAGSRERVRENKAFTEDAQLWASLLRGLPDTFGPAVKCVLDAKGITQEELAGRLGIDRRNLHKWWNQERASVPHVVGICVALGLRADLALALLRLSGNALRNTPEDDLYRMMLYSAETLDVERCNEILQQAGLPPLTKGAF